MLRWIGLGLKAAIVLLIAAFLHYTLPQRDIVRITEIDTQRVDFNGTSLFWASGEPGSDPARVNRDVQFIFAIRPDGNTVVYRNEDTGFGWPPYFKLDTNDLQAEAADLISTAEAPRWVLVRHYGWRSNLMSIYPNAVSIQTISSPDNGKPIPWMNIGILVLLAALLSALYVRWLRFRERRLDPTFDSVQESFEAASDKIEGRWLRLRRSWKG